MYASLIERTGWSLEYITNKPSLQALRVLADAWGEEADEMKRMSKNSSPSGINKERNATDLDPISMPNVWDGEKEGTAANAESFNRMLFGTK